MINLKSLWIDEEALERYRGLVDDQKYIDTMQATDLLITGLLDTKECDTQQEAFNAVFGLLQRDVAEYFNNQPRPMTQIKDTERYGREVKIITVELEAPGPSTTHTIEIYGDALFVNGEQIGGV